MDIVKCTCSGAEIISFSVLESALPNIVIVGELLWMKFEYEIVYVMYWKMLANMKIMITTSGS